jgi:protein disulfide-isomerase
MRPLIALTLASTLALAPTLATAAPEAASPTAASTAGPYDDAADAQADIRAAVAEAGRRKQQVLVVFGANWCGDCKMLDSSFKSGPVAPLIQRHYQVVKVNVGRFNVNVDIAERYGVPLKKGIPAVAVLNAKGEAIHATQGGELANARKMGDVGVAAYFEQLAKP